MPGDRDGGIGLLFIFGNRFSIPTKVAESFLYYAYRDLGLDISADLIWYLMARWHMCAKVLALACSLTHGHICVFLFRVQW
ncbi:MAG: hypothetical protein ABI045_00775 [Flavobacteriales bacterium]